MRDSKLRRLIAVEAARLMYERVEKEYFTAKRKAAARLGVNYRHNPQDLPSNREIREQIQSFARIHEGEQRDRDLRDMRLAALRLMRLLARFEPHLIGSVMTGHVRQGSDIDLHVFSDDVSAVSEVLDQHGLAHEIERKRIIKHNQERLFTHMHIAARFNVELTVYARELVSYPFKSSITGKTIERVGVSELEAIMAREHPDAELPPDDEEPAPPDPFLIWSLLLPPLEEVRQDPRFHPEGDALFHSLQAFELARERFPFDAEMITAALLHDVGKAIDASDHVEAGLEALEGTLSEREAFLIEHHMDALAYRDGTLSGKRRAKLRESEFFEDLMALREIDEAARVPGAAVCTVEEAIAFLRGLAEETWE